MGRTYKSTGGRKLPSVTTVLDVKAKPALIQWASNCAGDYLQRYLDGKSTYDLSLSDLQKIAQECRYAYKKISSKATGGGTAVHKAIETYLKTGKLIDLSSDEEMAGMLAFLEFWKARGGTVFALERTVYFDDEEWGYAGTFDLLAEIDGVVTLCDFKTSKAIYDEYSLQLAAYMHAYNLNPIVKNGAQVIAERNSVLRVDKLTGKPEYKDFTDRMPKDLKKFETLCRFWHLENTKE